MPFECIDFDQTQSSSCLTTAVLTENCFIYILIDCNIYFSFAPLLSFYFSISMGDCFGFIRLTKRVTGGTIKLDLMDHIVHTLQVKESHCFLFTENRNESRVSSGTTSLICT